MFRMLFTTVAAAGIAAVSVAGAAELRIGLASAPTSIDPHFHNSGPNSAFARNVFEPLVKRGPALELEPGLATSWTPLSDTEWEFTLREGGVFHNGAPFTADDVIFSIERVPNVPDSPSSFGFAVAAIESIERLDDHTLRLTTAAPAPNLPSDLSTFVIVSEAAGRDAQTADYTRGDAMIGTGPVRFVSSRTGEVYELERFDDYWGGPSAWERVSLRVISSEPARVAALLSGDVDLIERVPATDVPRLEANPDTVVWSGPTNRVAFISLDVEREEVQGNFATDRQGRPLERNPMLDKRVRQALSYSINREQLVERALGGDGVLTSNLVPVGFFGYNPNIPMPPYDPELSRQLLAEAGFPDGFNMVFHTSSDRIDYAPRVVQVLAQFWARIGINTQIELMPHSVYIPASNNFELSYMMHSWGTGTGEASHTLNGIAVTRNREAGTGGSNRGRYSNPRVDEITEEARRTLDEAKRRALLEEAMAIVVGDYGIIPLYAQRSSWATRAGIDYIPQVSQMTIASDARPSD